MKKTIIILTIVTLLFVAAFSFSGCSLIAKAQGKTYISYVQSGAYSVGTMEGDIIPEDILIDWYGGSVNVTKYEGDKIIFVEKTNQETNDDLKLHWAYWDSSEYGKYYQIQYCAKGMYDLSEIKKDLYVFLPNNVDTYNKLSITARGECSINIYLPDVSFVGECNGNPNVHLDAEWGNINATFKDVDYFRMLGDADDVANQYYRKLVAQKVDQIECVASYNKFIFKVDEVTSYANINTFSGDVYFLCQGNIKKLSIDSSLGTKYITAMSFNKLDFTSTTGIIGVEMDARHKFQVTMSNYTKYSNNLQYKDPQFMGRVGYVPYDELQPGDPDDLYDVTHSGDVWTIRDGKDKYGRINEVKVSTGSDTYFGSFQSLHSTFEETGVFEHRNDEVEISIPDEYKTQDPQQNEDDNQGQDNTQDPQYDPNNPNWNPNNNNNQN